MISTVELKSGGGVGSGYLRPDQILDHLTVITKEENIREEDDDANKENKSDEAEDCLWSLTTDAGISRRTTFFRIGTPVVHYRYKEQEKEGDFDVK